MCGIVGIVSDNNFSSNEAISRLKRLEYRGYDSFGFATKEGIIKKSVGGIKELEEESTNTIILHTRWATHGEVNEANAHPHSDCEGKIFAVHNGIIDNYKELKKDLEIKGHNFKSDTDSEIITHFFEENKDLEMKDAVKLFFSKVKGEFAILLIRKHENKIYAFKRGSPLVLGLGNGEKILSSDIYAFSDKINDVIFFNENEFAEIGDDYIFYKFDGELTKIEKPIEKIEWAEEEEKHNYDHHMIKEIMEQPISTERLINSLKTDQKIKIDELKNLIDSSKKVVFLAAGSSYHASLLGMYFLRKAGIETHTIIASEFKNFTMFDENTLVIAISQSGETMDVIKALNGIKEKGVTIASLVNVSHSTVQRMSNISINIMAGQEICVAATKTFTNQILSLLYIASLFGYEENLDEIPNMIKNLLKQEKTIKEIARTLKDKNDIYVLGRGFSYSVAREIALKLKEISYVHAEGMMGGELKHGTLALIEKDTPVIVIEPKTDNDIHSNAKEVEARGARVISLYENSDFDGIKIEAANKGSFAILATIAGQILTYYLAKEKNLPIDKPRNLAKSVTVK